MASQEQRIARQLVVEAATGPFHPVSYDRNRLKTVDLGTKVLPAESLAQAISASFGVPRSHRRADRLERRAWRWNLDCKFPEEVSLEEFEKRIIKNPPILARDPANELEQVTLKLQSADPFHPPQQDPSVGTLVTFIFEAELSSV